LINSRRLQSWVWLLLPLLVARALMPVGFMAQLHDGKLQVVFCTAGYSQPYSDDHNKGKHTAQSDFSCPFASVAAAPLLDVSGSEAIAFIETTVFLPLTELPYYAAGPPRTHRVRGPPVLA
jgi:Protein of unknown function (DUF2946)